VNLYSQSKMGCTSISNRLQSIVILPQLMLICITLHPSNSEDLAQTLSFEQGAAPDALVFSVCDFTNIDLVVSYGSWSRGIYTALRFNNTIVCENFYELGGVIRSLSSNNCIQLSVNPSRLNYGRSIVQAMLCDEEGLQLLKSPSVKVHSQSLSTST
jgi:hypothetical protein